MWAVACVVVVAGPWLVAEGPTGALRSRRVALRRVGKASKNRTRAPNLISPYDFRSTAREPPALGVEREHAGTVWEEGGWMFIQPNGRPIGPEQDAADWKQLLAAADVRDARLHDARHTAATVLLILGVHRRVVMDLMGGSSEAMVKRYQHMSDELRRDVAQQVNGLLWGNK